MRLLFLQVTVLGTLLTAVPWARAGYLYTPFSYPGAMFGTTAEGISGSSIVGYAYTPIGQAFVYDGSTYSSLPSLGPTYNGSLEATGISGGTIIGNYFDASHNRIGFVFSGGSYTGSVTAPGAYYPQVPNQPFGYGTRLSGISGNSMVGSYTDSSLVQHGFIDNAGNFTILNGPAGSTSAAASGIWETTVVGSYGDSSSISHGFIYSNGTYTTLDDPQATGGTFPTGISGNLVVGFYTMAGSSLFNYGFLYDMSNGTFTPINDPLGTYSGTTPMGIDGTTIVGYYGTPNGVNQSFVATEAAVPEPEMVGALFCAVLLAVLRRGRWHGPR